MSRHDQLQQISCEHYLQGELSSSVKHEYVAGQVFAMGGGTAGHNRIALNIASFLHNHLRGTPYRPYMSDMKVRVEATDAFYYPDVVVSCETLDSKALYLQEPLLIVEVLSPSTEAIDRREKRLNYQKLTSLKDYALVSTEHCKVDIYRCDQGMFKILDIYNPEDLAVEFSSLQLQIPLDDIYTDVLVESEQSR